MLKRIVTVSFCILFIEGIFAQSTFLSAEKSPEYSAQFLKRIENNIIRMGLEDLLEDGSINAHYNLDSKTGIEKLFFGDINAPVEFFFEPDFDAPFGFRILRNSSMDESYSLEVKNIPNDEKVRQELLKKYPAKGFSIEQLESVPDSVRRQSAQYNNAQWQKQREERLVLSRVETRSFPVCNRFAEILYKKVVALIEHFDGNQVSRRMEGYRVTFRCVVENEVWTLLIKEVPQENVGRMFDLCKQIMMDADVNKLNETKYIALLDDLCL
jgi:hypothetical protein